MHKQPWGRVLFTVNDRATLARRVHEQIDKRFGGSQNAAAKALGIGQSQISRLIKNPPRTLRPQTVGTLKRLKVEFWDCVLSEQGRALLDGYLDWLTAWEKRVRRGIAERWEWSAQEKTFVTTRGWDTYDDRGEPLRGSTRNRDRVELRARLKPQGMRLLERFEAWMTAKGFRGLRAELALARILDPLTDAPESAYVERGWPELSDRELERFLKAGIVREKIVLNRPTHLPRLQDIERKIAANVRPADIEWRRWSEAERETAVFSEEWAGYDAPNHYHSLGVFDRKKRKPSVR